MADATWNALRAGIEALREYTDTCEALDAMEAALAAQQPAQGEAVAFDLTLDEDEARTLRDGIGDGCVQAVRLQVGEGHGGYGLYVSSLEYPEDGSSLVCEMIERTAPPAPSVPDELRESYGCNPSYINGWNACRAAMLAAAPEPPR